jgi:plastocyanin
MYQTSDGIPVCTVRRRPMAVRSTILLAALVAAVACSGDDNGDGGQGPGETPEGDILVRNNAFVPSELAVATGTSVVWAWQAGSSIHNVTFDDGQTSGNQSSGTYERAFGAAGSYPYHCTIHGTATSGMRGVVTVDDAPATGNGGGGSGGGSGGPGY